MTIFQNTLGGASFISNHHHFFPYRKQDVDLYRKLHLCHSPPPPTYHCHHYCSHCRKRKVVPYSKPTFANHLHLNYHHHCSQRRKRSLIAIPPLPTVPVPTTVTMGPNAGNRMWSFPTTPHLPIDPTITATTITPNAGSRNFSFTVTQLCPCPQYHYGCSQCRKWSLTTSPLFPTAFTSTITTIAPNP